MSGRGRDEEAGFVYKSRGEREARHLRESTEVSFIEF